MVATSNGNVSSQKKQLNTCAAIEGRCTLVVVAVVVVVVAAAAAGGGGGGGGGGGVDVWRNIQFGGQSNFLKDIVLEATDSK